MADVLPLGDFSSGLPAGMSPEQLAALMQALQGSQSAGSASVGMPGQPMPRQAPQTLLGPMLSQPPSMLSAQPPEMPAPQEDAPQPVQLPSLMNARPPALPPAIPPTARPATSLGPVAPSGVDDAEDAPNANLPVARAVPQPPVRPAEFAPSATAVPATTGAVTDAPALTGPANAVSKPSGPSVGTPPADDGGFDLGRTLKRVGDSGIGDTLLAFGGGLLSGKNWNEGLGAGFSAASRVGTQQQASQIAQGEYALKMQKARQEQGALTANAQLVKSKLAAQGQNISDDQALAYANNGSFMSELLKGALPPTEQYTTYTDDKGNQFTRNTRTGQPSLLLKAEDDKTQTPLTTPEARAAAGLAPDDTRRAWIDPNKKVTFDSGPEQTADIRNWQEAKRQGYEGSLVDYQNQRALAGRNQTTINMPPTEQARDKKIGDAIGTDISDYIAASRPAREKLAALNVLSDAWKAGGDKITTGPAAERVLALKQFARGSLGMNIGDDIAPSELISKIGTQLATADAKSLTARPTQFDFATYLKNNPGLTLTPEGNAALIDIKRQQAQHELDLAALARKKENWDNFDDVVAQYDKTHPIVSSLTGKALDASSVQFPGPASRQSAPVTGAAVPGGAVQALQQDPRLAAQFEAKYGRGSASRYLGGR